MRYLRRRFEEQARANAGHSESTLSEMGKSVGHGELHEVDLAVRVQLLHDPGTMGIDGFVKVITRSRTRS